MDEEQYKKEMEILQGMLNSVSDNIQAIADRLANGAILSSPNEYRNPELFELHHRLTEQADRIIDKMQEVHKAFNQAT